MWCTGLEGGGLASVMGAGRARQALLLHHPGTPGPQPSSPPLHGCPQHHQSLGSLPLVRPHHLVLEGTTDLVYSPPETLAIASFVHYFGKSLLALDAGSV